ncbi:MAG TPA: adenylate/guanylate cyclase domain-containing protein [Spirochaetia bacterium]|nr:adenylate/guanylate cyclase domain-containing protein [Spirochaetia bacterium]
MSTGQPKPLTAAPTTDSSRGRVIRFFDELLLSSGQYALFYVLMNFSSDGSGYFGNPGHDLLLVLLAFQTVFLTLYGSRSLTRFFGSLVAPLVYTIFEAREGLPTVLNAGHVFFWVFSVAAGGLKAFALLSHSARLRKLIEAVNTVLNVLVFLFLYMYFDVRLKLDQQIIGGALQNADYQRELEVPRIFYYMADFISDPAHVYVLLGGAVLSTALAFGRVQVITLKDQINDLFGKYLDRDVRDSIIRRGARGAERSLLTVLFCDIRSFTAASENRAPEDITGMLNYYYTEWEAAVNAHGGTIDKYIGDAIMVVFGLKRPESACSDAVRCAGYMLDQLPRMNAELTLRELPVLKGIGIGINHGEMIVGDIGSENRRNFTVIGDQVNLASRLESASKRFDSAMIVSESVFSRLDSELRHRFAPLGNLVVKGRAGSITAYKYACSVPKLGGQTQLRA